MTRPLRIDFISDVACPWCVIGLRSLQEALHKLDGAVIADIKLGAFELNPGIAPEGENIAEHVRKKYGASADRSALVRQAIKAHGEALGFAFNYSAESRIWNTFDAHRLLHLAAGEGRALALKEALFKATFTDQRATNDPDVLVNAAEEAGLDAARARQIVESDTFADAVRVEEQLWRSRGIEAVPSIIFDAQWLIQGAQSPEAYERAIRQIISGQAQEAPAN
jgi:predicted DsbA family dithiol-disulfide isomerase